MTTMKLFYLILIAYLNPLIAFPSGDMWLCKEESSKRNGHSINACGVGTGNDENAARLNAFDNSKTEFTKICQSSDDCKDHSITVTPQRTSCEQLGTLNFKCYRMITFTIGLALGNQAPSKGTDKNTFGTQQLNISPTLDDTPDHFESFSLNQVKNYPRVKKGMSKDEVMQIFGAPERTRDEGSNEVVFWYRGKMCHGYNIDPNANSCAVHFVRGDVKRVFDFKPVYDGVALDE